MKKILSLLGAIALTSIAATSVVACGGGEQQKADKEYADAIVKQLGEGVDGSALTIVSTESDAVILFQAAATKIKEGAIVSLVTLGDATKPLDPGDNTIKVKITVNKEIISSTDAIVKGVTGTDAECVAAIKTKLEAGVDGSTLDTSNTQADALKLFQDKAKSINSDSIVILVTLGDATKSLDTGDNTIKVKIIVNKEIISSIDAVVKGINTSNEKYANIIKIALEHGVDGSTLDTWKKQVDAVTLFQAVAIKIKNDLKVATVATVTLVTPADAQHSLQLGDNTIKVKVTAGAVILPSIDAIVKGVTQA